MVDTAGNASSTSLTTSGNINVGGNLTVSGTANISGISFTSANASTTYLTVGNTAWINNLVATNASTTYATLPTFWGTNGTITNASQFPTAHISPAELKVSLAAGLTVVRRQHLSAKRHCYQWLCCFRFLIQCWRTELHG